MNLRSALFLTIIISVITSCTKIDTTDIGANLIPPVDNIHTFDTSYDVITTNLFDTGVIYPLRSDNMALGRISNDPLFGKTTAIINMELKPDYFPFSFAGAYDSLKLDSVVLVLSYKGIFGDSTKPQNLKVYELTPTSPNVFKSDSFYTTRQKFQHQASPIATASIDVRKLLINDTLSPNGEVANGNQIRIKITDPSFQQRIFKDSAALDSNVAFMNKFPGLAIVPDTSSATPNSLFYISLSDTNTKLAIYYTYRILDSPSRKQTVDYFHFNSACAFSNNIIRNPAGAEYLQHFGNTSDSLLYLQTRPDAPYAKIKIPALNNLPNSIIHRAELVIQQVPYTPDLPMDKYFSPPALFLTVFSADSSRKFMLPGSDINYSISGVNNFSDFGSFPFHRTTNGKDIVNYAFTLTSYVQGIATKKNRNFDLVLSAPFADYIYATESFNTLIPIAGSGVVNPLAAGRIRVGGGTHSQYKMKLRVIYTRL